MKPQTRIVLAGLAGAVLMAGLSFADVLHLERGGRLEGVLVRETATRVTIDVGMGEISLPRTAISRIERKVSPLSEFRARLSASDSTDPRVCADLARFAAGHGLGNEARQMWSRVLALDPRNVEAHLALGHVLVDGTYLEEADAYRARGLVEFDGQWMTPAEQASLLHERERRSAASARAEEARRAERRAEEEARRARIEMAEARSRASENPVGYPVWGFGPSVIVGGPHGGGYGGGCPGGSCVTVPQIWPQPPAAPRATPIPRAVPVRPSSIR